jgi:hypothetical protein
MLLVRYFTLAALVIWIGAMVGDVLQRVHFLAYISGGVVVAGLTVMKFVGPPPSAFVPRLVIVLVMLTVAILTGVSGRWTNLSKVNVALGMALLFWYVRE